MSGSDPVFTEADDTRFSTPADVEDFEYAEKASWI